MEQKSYNFPHLNPKTLIERQGSIGADTVVGLIKLYSRHSDSSHKRKFKVELQFTFHFSLETPF